MYNVNCVTSAALRQLYYVPTQITYKILFFFLMENFLFCFTRSTVSTELRFYEVIVSVVELI